MTTHSPQGPSLAAFQAGAGAAPSAKRAVVGVAPDVTIGGGVGGGVAPTLRVAVLRFVAALVQRRGRELHCLAREMLATRGRGLLVLALRGEQILADEVPRLLVSYETQASLERLELDTPQACALLLSYDPETQFVLLPIVEEVERDQPPLVLPHCYGGFAAAAAGHACAHCRASGAQKLWRCAGCKWFFYCSRGCQRAGWQAGHRHECAAMVKLEEVSDDV